MKKSSVALAGLFGNVITAEVIEQSFTDDTFDSRVKDLKEKFKISKAEDFIKLEANIKKESAEKAISELVEKAMRVRADKFSLGRIVERDEIVICSQFLF